MTTARPLHVTEHGSPTFTAADLHLLAGIVRRHLAVCPVCHGERDVIDLDTPATLPEREPCPACHGRGKVNTDRWIPY